MAFVSESCMHKATVSYHYLLTFGAVVTAASVGFHVILVACWVHAFFREAYHAFADLEMSVVSSMVGV